MESVQELKRLKYGCYDMADYLERKITVFEPSYVRPIYVVQNSNMHEIRIVITDWNIPSGADVYWQVATETKGELNVADVDGSTIYIRPYTTTFSEAGKGYLQVRVEANGRVLISFSIDVYIQEDKVSNPVEGSNSDVIKVLVEQYVDEATGTLFEDLEAQANAERESIEAVGERVIESIPSDYTELTESVVMKNGFSDVTPQNLQIVDAEISPNLIDESKITRGIYIQKNGAESSGNYRVTDYIPVEQGEQYCLSWKYGASSQTQVLGAIRFLACYDETKTIIPSAGSDANISPAQITIADGVSFVRLSFNNNDNYHDFQFEQSADKTEYHPYGEVLSAVIKDEYLPVKEVDMADIPAFELVDGQNLLNQDDPDFSVGFLNANGTIDSTNTAYRTSGFIAVNEGDKIIGSYKVTTGEGRITLRTVACFNSDKSAVTSKVKYSVTEFVVPQGISYIRVCYSYSTYGDYVQICKAVSNSYFPYKPYEAPHYELKKSYENSDNSPLHVYLPTDVYVAVGRTIEFYNEQVVIDHEKYRFRWVCGKGSALKRKFTFTATTTENLNLNLELYDDEMKMVWRGTCTIHSVSASNPTKNILPIGDSLTNWKAWLQEVKLLSSNNITFVGTRYSGQSVDSEGNTYPSGSIHHEGRSGWGADSYLADTQYTFDNRYDGVSSVDGKANPFWDGSKFSLNHYLTTQTGVSTPDAVQIFLGTNDLINGVDTAVTNISAIVNSVRSEYPNLPIFVCNTIYRSNQNGYGSVGQDAYSSGGGASAWQYDQDVKVQDLMKGLLNELGGVTGIYFIPLATCMDREYGFGQVATAVNPRSTVTVNMPAESVHPQASGYYQMADLMYSYYCGVLN